MVTAAVVQEETQMMLHTQVEQGIPQVALNQVVSVVSVVQTLAEAAVEVEIIKLQHLQVVQEL